MNVLNGLILIVLASMRAFQGRNKAIVASYSRLRSLVSLRGRQWRQRVRHSIAVMLSSSRSDDERLGSTSGCRLVNNGMLGASSANVPQVAALLIEQTAGFTSNHKRILTQAIKTIVQ